GAGGSRTRSAIRSPISPTRSAATTSGWWPRPRRPATSRRAPRSRACPAGSLSCACAVLRCAGTTRSSTSASGCARARARASGGMARARACAARRSTPASPALSVVVPTLGRAASVRRLLLSLTGQAEPPAFEVIVSIDGGGDETRDIVDSFAGRLPVRALSRPRGGRGAACNAGAREAEGRVLVLLDDDMEATNGFLRAHARAHPAGARMALVGPAPIEVDASAPPLVRYRAALFERKLERLRAAAEPRVRDMYTGNFSVPRELFLQPGGFDEGMVRYGNEDFELLVRLRRAGARLGLAPAAIAVQHYEKGYRELARDTLDEGWSAVLFAERHPDLLDDIY